MPDEIPGGVWAGVAGIIAAITAAALAWIRAGKSHNRIVRRDAVKEWQHLYDQLNARFNDAQNRSDDNRQAIATLKARVDDCETKHEKCEEQHQECERNLSAVKKRLDSLEDTVTKLTP